MELAWGKEYPCVFFWDCLFLSWSFSRLKVYSCHGLTFLNHIYVEDFSLYHDETTAKVDFEDKIEYYKVSFLEFEDFTCAYALLNDRKKNG